MVVLVEFGADLVGVGVTQVCEDVQGLLPGIPGGSQVSGSGAGVAEAGQGVGLTVELAEVAEDGQGVLVAGRSVI